MMNPLLWLDLRVRVRERRLWVIALLVMAVPFISALLMTISMNKFGSPDHIGTSIGMVALFGQVGILILLAPLASAQRISQEREQRTYAALVNSPLKPSRIVWGKLLGTWIFVFWLWILTLPFLAIAMLWGGFAPWVLLFCFAANLLVAIALSSLALGFSGLFGRSLSAYLCSGGILFLWCAAIPIIGVIVSEFAWDWSQSNFWTQLESCIFFYHAPIAPQIWLVARGGGVFDTYTSEWGAWTALYGVAVWFVLMLIGYLLALRGVKREVY